MASISQTTPWYIQGISEQPDQLKKPGQVRDCLNIIPDVTDGLKKRPPAQFLSILRDYNKSAQLVPMADQAAWFSIDQTDKYIGRVHKDGEIGIWKNDGAACSFSDVSTAGLCSCSSSYLAHTNPESIKFLTINDHTFILNREKEVSMLDTDACQWGDPDHTHYTNPNIGRPYEAFINVISVNNGQQYPLDIGKYASTGTKTTNTRATKLKAEWIETQYGSPRGMDVIDDNATRYTYQKVHTINPTPLPTGGSINPWTAVWKRNLRFHLKMEGMPYSRGRDYFGMYRLEIDLLHGGYGWQVGDYFHVEMGDISTKTWYKITVEETEEWTSNADIGIVRPCPTPVEVDATLSVDSILEQLIDEITDKTSNHFIIEKIGTGLHLIERNPGSSPTCREGTPFDITTSEHGVMEIITSSASDIQKLPGMCKDGYLVKIENSPNQEDDHWMKFVGDSGKDGSGHWEETYDPCVDIAIDPCTMPHKLVRQTATSFTLETIDWGLRAVGDDVTNSKPSFVDQKINNILFFRNRLTLLSQENIILSQSGDFYNFWAISAKEMSDADVIDVAASSTQPITLVDGVGVNQGLVLFSPFEQFMLTTQESTFTPRSAVVNNLASYDYNLNVKPFVLGTNIGFTSNSGLKSRFWEMGDIRRDGPPTVIEQSISISDSLPSNLLTAATSRDNHIALFTGYDPTVTSYGDCIDPYTNVWGYRYFNSGEKRLQSAWFRWRFFGEIVWHTIMDNTYYVVLYWNNDAHFCAVDLEDQSASYLLNDSNTCDDHRVFLDNSWKMAGTYGGISHAGTYSAATDKTTWHLPQWHRKQPTTQAAVSGGQQVIYATTGPKAGQVAVLPSFTANSVSTFSIQGNWSSSTVHLGYTYDMMVEFPQIFLTKQEGKGSIQDTNSALTVHRTKFSMGPSGYYSTVLQRKGRSDYVQNHESSKNHSFNLNAYNINLDGEVTVPIYANNRDYRLKLLATHPTPCTLYGQTWEGDYNSKFYRRV